MNICNIYYDYDYFISIYFYYYYFLLLPLNGRCILIPPPKKTIILDVINRD